MKKNYFYNMIYQVLSLLIPIVTTPYLSRTLGADAIGIFSYAYSIVVLFTTVAVLGTTTYGQRLIAYTRDDRAKLSVAFCKVFMLRLVTTITVIIVYIMYVNKISEYTGIQLLLVLNLINVILDITWLYQGLEEFKKILTRNIFIKLLNLISIYAFIYDEKDLDVYILIYCGYTILGNTVTWIGIRKYIDFCWKINPFNDIKEVFALFLPSIAMQVYTILDKVMLGAITSSTYESGCYELAEKICRIATTIVAAIAIVITPRIANMYSKYKSGEKSKECIIDLAYYGIRVSCMLAFPIVFGIISMTTVFVPVFLGGGYDKVIVLLPIFSFLVLIVGLANIIGVAYLIPTEKQNVYTASIIVSAVVNLLLNIWFIPKWLSVGAAMASVIAELIGLLIQLGYCLFYEKFSAVRVGKIVWRYAVSSLVMFLCVFYLKKYVVANTAGLVILICIGVCVYGIGLLIFRDELIMEIFRAKKEEYVGDCKK